MGEKEQKPPKLVHVVVANPAGKPDDSITSFFKESELKELELGYIGKPLYIEHMTETPEGVENVEPGKKISPSGVVVGAGIDPETKELIAMFVTHDTPNGELADKLLDPKNPDRMQMVSMGYRIKMKDGIPLGNETDELSITYQGAHDSTYILGSLPLDKLLEAHEIRAGASKFFPNIDAYIKKPPEKKITIHFNNTKRERESVEEQINKRRKMAAFDESPSAAYWSGYEESRAAFRHFRPQFNSDPEEVITARRKKIDVQSILRPGEDTFAIALNIPKPHIQEVVACASSWLPSAYQPNEKYDKELSHLKATASANHVSTVFQKNTGYGGYQGNGSYYQTQRATASDFTSSVPQQTTAAPMEEEEEEVETKPAELTEAEKSELSSAEFSMEMIEKNIADLERIKTNFVNISEGIKSNKIKLELEKPEDAPKYTLPEKPAASMDIPADTPPELKQRLELASRLEYEKYDREKAQAEAATKKEYERRRELSEKAMRLLPGFLAQSTNAAADAYDLERSIVKFAGAEENAFKNFSGLLESKASSNAYYGSATQIEEQIQKARQAKEAIKANAERIKQKTEVKKTETKKRNPYQNQPLFDEQTKAKRLKTASQPSQPDRRVVHLDELNPTQRAAIVASMSCAVPAGQERNPEIHSARGWIYDNMMKDAGYVGPDVNMGFLYPGAIDGQKRLTQLTTELSARASYQFLDSDKKRTSNI